MARPPRSIEKAILCRHLGPEFRRGVSVGCESRQEAATNKRNRLLLPHQDILVVPSIALVVPPVATGYGQNGRHCRRVAHDKFGLNLDIRDLGFMVFDPFQQSTRCYLPHKLERLAHGCETRVVVDGNAYVVESDR